MRIMNGCGFGWRNGTCTKPIECRVERKNAPKNAEIVCSRKQAEMLTELTQSCALIIKSNFH